VFHTNPSQYTYRGARRGESRRRLALTTGIVVLVFLADLVTGGVGGESIRAATGVLWSVGAQIERAIRSTGFVASRSSLASENDALRTQLAQYEQRVAAASAAVAENELLRSMARLAADEPGITAPVISSFQASPYGTFFVGAGTADGIMHGALVLSPDGYVIGRISDVGPHTALVDQLFAPTKELDALARDVPLSLVGEGGGNAVARAPRGSAVAVGDVVVAPTLGGRPVAVVGAAEADPAAAFTLVSARVPANIAALRFVYIIAGQ